MQDTHEGTGSKKAFSSRSGAATACHVLSILSGGICRILRAVEASQREGGVGIAILVKEGRSGVSVLSMCWRQDGGCEGVAKRNRRLRRFCSVIKL